MQDAPAATSTPTFQMFCFGQWSSSFPPSLCQPRWSSSRPAAIFQPRYLDYSFPDPSVNQHKACYGAMCILGPKRAIAVVKGAPGRFCVTELPHRERGVVRWGRGSILWDWSWVCKLPLGFSPNFKPQRSTPTSRLSLLELRSTHCIADCHLLAQWTVGTRPAWQTPHRSHC